jgi:hypothetical protein
MLFQRNFPYVGRSGSHRSVNNPRKADRARQHLAHAFGNFCHVIRAPAGRLTKSLASVRPSGYEARSAILLDLRPGSADLNLIEQRRGPRQTYHTPSSFEEGICKLSSRGGCGRVVTTRGWISDL